jgi:hypothetical protein
MGSFLVKIAIFAVVIIGLVLVVQHYKKGTEEFLDEQKTFSEVVDEDEARLRAPVEAEEVAEVKEEVKKEVVEFVKLSEIDEIEASRLFELAIKERSMSRLPGMSYKNMIDHCREIIKRWPGSEVAAQAKRMLTEVPKYKRARYKMTEAEIKGN